jgi:lipopolysaccharide export system permease protein
MRLISRHILRTLATPFCWGVAALTGLLLLQSLPPFIDRFGGKGLPGRIVLEAVSTFLPTLMGLTLPMAVLVATLYGYTQLAAAQEMVAMYANGISVWRMARPALIGAAVVALANFFIMDQLMPRSTTRLQDIQTAAANTTPTLALRQQVLNQLMEGYVLRANEIDPVTNGLRGVTIYDMANTITNGQVSRRIIRADSGSMAESPDGRDLILTLHHGEIYEFAREAPGRLQLTDFDDNRVVIRDVETQFRLPQSRFARISRNQQQKTGCELLDGIDEQRAQARNYRAQAEYMTRRDLRVLAHLPPLIQPSVTSTPAVTAHCGLYRKLERTIRSMILPGHLSAQQPPAAAPPGTAQQPVVPAQHPVSAGSTTVVPPTAMPVAPTILPLPQTPPPGLPPGQLLVPPTQQPAPGLTTRFEIENNTLILDNAAETVRRYQVEYHRKFAVPFSSFCFVLIGIALALKYPGSGIGLVIGGSLVIFLFFYIMLQLGQNLAYAGEVDPRVALYAPLTLLTAIGLIAVNAANREMGTARSDGIFQAFGNLFRRRQ